jgi:YHS domain-containing protein
MTLIPRSPRLTPHSITMVVPQWRIRDQGKERNWDVATVTDPVCGMRIDSSQAEAQSQYNGEAYYFCSEECKQLFDKNPREYVKPTSTQ